MEMFLQPAAFCIYMFVVAIFLLLSGFPVAFTLAGTAASFAFIGYFIGIFDITFLTAFPQRIFSTMSNEVLVAVPLFVFMGVMLERSKVAEELLDNMGRLFGRMPGGIAYSVSIVGMLLAASTGIVGATVVTMGLLSLPTMIRRGYSPSFACGSICASGTLGQIIPPSIVLVLLGDQLSVAFQNAQFAKGIFAPDTVSVNDLFAGALFPGLMLVGMYLIYQIGFSLLNPSKAPPIPPEPHEDGVSQKQFYLQLTGSLFAPLILIVSVLGSILAGLASPTEAAGVGAIGATFLAGYRVNPARSLPVIIGALCLVGVLSLTIYFDLRMQRDAIPLDEKIAIGAALFMSLGIIWGVFIAVLRTYGQVSEGQSVLISVMRQTLLISSMVFVILVGAGMFSLVFRGFEGDILIEAFLSNLPGGTITAMLVVMGVMFLMGFFLDFLEIIFIVVPIVAPILLQMEVAPGVLMSPVWLGVMMAINLQTSFLTPPFGFALFYLRGVAPDSVRTMDIYRGVAPFVLIQIIGLVLIWFMPEIATWLPIAVYGK